MKQKILIASLLTVVIMETIIFLAVISKKPKTKIVYVTETTSSDEPEETIQKEDIYIYSITGEEYRVIAIAKVREDREMVVIQDVKTGQLACTTKYSFDTYYTKKVTSDDSI